MSPSIASVVTPLSSPAVLSMSPSFPKSRDPVVSRCLASAHPPLFHAGGNALLLVLAQLFLRVELPAALRTLEQLHRYLLATSLRRRYFSVFGAGPLSFSASSTVTLSPFLTFWSADVGKCKSIRPSAVLTRSRPLSGVTLVTSPVIVWRPSSAASVAARVVDGCGGGFVGPCAIAKPASSRPAVVPASMAGSFMAFFSFAVLTTWFPEQRTCQQAPVCETTESASDTPRRRETAARFYSAVPATGCVLTV